MDIGLATVYRVLTQFEQAGPARTPLFESGKAVFEVNQGKHHDHLVCVDCGRSRNSSTPKSSAARTAIAESAGSPSRTTLYLYALCKDARTENRCLKQLKRCQF